VSVRTRGPLPDWEPDPASPRQARQAAILADLLDRLAQHGAEDTLPRSPRGLFYDLRPHGMGHGITYIKPSRDYPKTAFGPMEAHPDLVQEVLVLARRAGRVDEDDIEDGRAPDGSVPWYSDDTAEDYAAALVRQVRDPHLEYDPQTGQPVYLEVLVEAGGLVGRLARIAEPYGVPVYSGAGYDGLKGKRALARRATGRDVPTVVLRVSDYDPHGLAIAHASLEDSVAWAKHFGAEPGWLSFDRIALTRDQARDHGLLDAGGKAEADGLPVPVMDAILREAIEAPGRQDPGRRAQTLRQAAAERARITGLVLEALRDELEEDE
jgi:hypothetical protein